MAVRVTWSPSADANIHHYLLQSSADAVTWAQIASITHNTGDTAVYDASVGLFYYNDLAGIDTTYYRLAAVDALSQQSAWGTPFQAGASSSYGSYGPGGKLTLLGLRTLARNQSDTENDPHVSDEEMNMWVNQSLLELYDLLIKSYGDDYFTATAEITADGTAALYALPNGVLYGGAPAFYKGILVETPAPYGVSGQYITLNRFNMREKNRFTPLTQMVIPASVMPRYRLAGSSLMLQPVPRSGMVFKLWYAPKLAPLTSDAAEVDDWSGWLEYVIVDTAIKAVIKQERDPQALMLRRKELERRIVEMAGNRDTGEPATVSETAVDNPFGYGPVTGLGGPWW